MRITVPTYPYRFAENSVNFVIGEERDSNVVVVDRGNDLTQHPDQDLLPHAIIAGNIVYAAGETGRRRDDMGPADYANQNGSYQITTEQSFFDDMKDVYEGKDKEKPYTRRFEDWLHKTHSKQYEDFNANFTPVVAVYQEGNWGVDGGLEIILFNGKAGTKYSDMQLLAVAGGDDYRSKAVGFNNRTGTKDDGGVLEIVNNELAPFIDEDKTLVGTGQSVGGVLVQHLASGKDTKLDYFVAIQPVGNPTASEVSIPGTVIVTHGANGFGSYRGDIDGWLRGGSESYAGDYVISAGDPHSGWLNGVAGNAHDTALAMDAVLAVSRGDYEERDFCFPAGTAITMADGSLKPIEQIVAGDQVASFSGFGALVPASVTQAFSKGVAPLVAVNGTQLRTTAGHVFASAQRRERVPAGPGDTQQKLTAAELLALARSQPDTFRFAFKRIDQMVEGEDLLLLEDGRFHAFTGIRDLGTAEQIYNFTVAGLHSYVAGGFRVHNDSLSALIDSMGVEGINWIDRGADKLTNPWRKYYYDKTHDDNPNNDGLGYIAKFGADFVEGVAHVGAAIWDSTIGALNRWSDRRKAKKIEKLHDAGVDIRDFLSPA